MAAGVPAAMADVIFFLDNVRHAVADVFFSLANSRASCNDVRTDVASFPFLIRNIRTSVAKVRHSSANTGITRPAHANDVEQHIDTWYNMDICQKNDIDDMVRFNIAIRNISCNIRNIYINIKLKYD